MSSAGVHLQTLKLSHHLAYSYEFFISKRNPFFSYNERCYNIKLLLMTTFSMSEPFPGAQLNELYIGGEESSHFEELYRFGFFKL